MFNRFSICAHSIVAGLGVLLAIIVLAQGPDRTVALSPTRHLATQAGPPREIRSVLENQLSSMASSLEGPRVVAPPAESGPGQSPAVTNERVLSWPLLELACEHVKQSLLNQFCTEVAKFQPDPNRTVPGPEPRGAVGAASPAGAGHPGLTPGDPHAAPAVVAAPPGVVEQPSTGPAAAEPAVPLAAQAGVRPDTPSGEPRPGPAVDPNAGPAVARVWDPNQWADRCACYERLISGYADVTLKVAVANQIGIFLSQQRQLPDAMKWFAHILPDAEKLRLERCVRLNMALDELDLARTAAARSQLQVVLDSVNTAGTDPFAWGVYLLAAGIMSNIEQVEGHPEPATQVLEQARRRIEALAAQLPNETWPTFYLGMVHVWRLRIAAESVGPGPQPALAALHKEFLKSVPLGRWTWLQHQVFRDTLEPRPVSSPAAALPQAREDEP